MTPGILSVTLLPGWPNVAAGARETLDAALASAGLGPSTVSPDGLHVDDVTTAQNTLSSYLGSPAQLAWSKTVLLAQLSDYYTERYSAGRVYAVPGDASGAHTYQIDPASIQNIMGAGAWANAVVVGTANVAPWPTGFVFIDESNTSVPMTADQCAAFASNVGAYVTSLILNNRALKSAIGNAASMSALQAIDTAAGWPANP